MPLLQIIENFAYFVLFATGTLLLSIFIGLLWYIAILFLFAGAIKIFTNNESSQSPVSNKAQTLSFVIVIALSICLAIISCLVTIRAGFTISYDFIGWAITALFLGLGISIIWGRIIYWSFSFLSDYFRKESLKSNGAIIVYLLIHIGIFTSFLLTIKKAIEYIKIT